MSRKTKIKLATALCVVSFIAVVVLVFVAPKASGLALFLGLYSGMKARKWKAEASVDNGGANEVSEVSNLEKPSHGFSQRAYWLMLFVLGAWLVIFFLKMYSRIR